VNMLAVDCSCGFLSVAVTKNDLVKFREAYIKTGHSELIMEYIDSLMKESALRPCDLNGVLCMGGPGSFTGLRIGYSIAKGLAISLSIPFAPVPTLDCIAFEGDRGLGVRDQGLGVRGQGLGDRNQGLGIGDRGSIVKDGLLLAVIEARKNACFYAFFEGTKRITADADGDYQKIAEEIKSYGKTVILKGPGSSAFFDSLTDLKDKIILKGGNKGYSRELIAIAKIDKIFDNDNTKYLYSGPEYIRKTDAELNWAG